MRVLRRAWSSLLAIVDLFLVAALALAAICSIVYSWPPIVNVPLATLLVLFLPGYAAVSALFADNGGPDLVSRLALGVAVSLAFIPPIGLALDWSPWEINRTSLTTCLGIITAVLVVVAVHARMNLPKEEQFQPSAYFSALWSVRGLARQNRLATVAVGLTALLFVAGGYQVVRIHVQGAPMTEFALLNEEGNPEFYPREVAVGEIARVNVSVANHEGKPMDYRIVVSGDGQDVDPTPDFTLEDGEERTQEIQFTLTKAGDGQIVRFELLTPESETNASPYRYLQLYVDGSEAIGQ